MSKGISALTASRDYPQPYIMLGPMNMSLVRTALPDPDDARRRLRGARLTFIATRLILRSVPPLLAARGRCVAAASGEPVRRPS